MAFFYRCVATPFYWHWQLSKLNKVTDSHTTTVLSLLPMCFLQEECRRPFTCTKKNSSKIDCFIQSSFAVSLQQFTQTQKLLPLFIGLTHRKTATKHILIIFLAPLCIAHEALQIFTWSSTLSERQQKIPSLEKHCSVAINHNFLSMYIRTHTAAQCTWGLKWRKK